ncbi:hypothetical protein Athai_02670 [Actinocatenispora thailandica]|uniref:Solute-binding protein family 5 domain-containing protein n=1 Tax=Actinocatenispora thailandica TaxID=227318 RepID=A0A7R7HVD4_9ACTN|nr:ABC transporter substrate-binding protein [Actinocatenispora thailandica]BCJ32764.1 hypothetical protein Athai_02670 [Actinocatenispora thailandica]
MKRRAFAGLTAAGGFAAVMGTAGCTDSSSSSSADVFTAIETEIDANAPINPYNQKTNSFQGYNAMKLGWAKNSLTDANAFYPALAASWSETPDHLKLTVKLRPDAKWSDGKPVTADDVKASAAVSFSQGGGAFAIAPGAAGGVGAVTVVDAHTIEFDQAPGSSNNSFLRNVLNMWVVPNSVYGPQMPANVWDLIKTATDPKASKKDQASAQSKIQALGKKLVEFGPKKDVSAGPFVLQRVNPGEAVLVKNTHFFDADKIAPSKVVLKNYSGNEQIWNYLISGDLDAAIYTATPANVRKKILAKQGNKMISGFSPVAAALAFNQSVKPLDNVHVRRALAYLIDRKLTTKIGESVGGSAAQTTTGLISDAANAWIGQDAVDKLNQYPHDAAKAEAELKKAGMSKKGGQWIQANGKPFTLQLQVPNGFSDWIAGGKSISSQLTDAGIKTEVKTSADYATYLSEIAEGKYQMGFWLVALGPSTHDAYARLYGPSNGWNQFGANVQHSAPGKNGNWMGGAETATIPGFGTINPGKLTNNLAQATEAEQKEIIKKLAAYSNDQLPAIQIWDYTNIQFVNTSRFTNFPKNDSDVLRLHPGMWMQLGYIQKKK